MNPMDLSPENIEKIKVKMTNPKEYGYEFPRLDAIFVPSETATPRHEAHEQYLAAIDKAIEIPRPIFYIVLDRLYRIGSALSGDHGWMIQRSELKNFEKCSQEGCFRAAYTEAEWGQMVCRDCAEELADSGFSNKSNA